MKFAPYWTRARVDDDGNVDPNGVVTAFGWSMNSVEDAATMALERARRIAARLANLEDDGFLRHHGEYYSDGDRPLREPIVEQVHHNGALSAAITRNSAGCLVLNTATTAFVDIDLPPAPRLKQPGFFARLFGAKLVEGPSRAERERPILERVERVMAEHADVGMRLYRTRNGFRGLVTHRPYEPTDPAILDLMRRLGTDPLYVRLCEIQECFRARLTPKPWRAGFRAAPETFFPWREDPEAKACFEAWRVGYEAAALEYSVCEEVGHFGPAEVHADVQPIVDLHARRVGGGRPLA